MRQSTATLPNLQHFLLSFQVVLLANNGSGSGSSSGSTPVPHLRDAREVIAVQVCRCTGTGTMVEITDTLPPHLIVTIKLFYPLKESMCIPLLRYPT